MTIIRVSLTLLLCLIGATLVHAQSTTAPASRLLGEKFESRAAGISLRPPAGSTQMRSAPGGGEVVQFKDDERKWVIKINRVLLDDGKPLPLLPWKDKQGKEYPGMLDLTVEQFKVDRPGATILRQDVTNIGEVKVGMIVARYDFGLDSSIMQQAILRADDLQYYVLSMNSPAPRTGDVAADAGVKLAVETFTQMLDSVEVHDQMELAMDRNERLMRTKVLYVNLNERKLRSVLQKDQWFRLIRNGKDIGYTYVIEQVGHDLPRTGRQEIATGPEGVLIGVRSRLIPEAGLQTDGESWLFTTFDRKVEAFSTQSYTQTPNGKSTSGELGTSRWREKMVADAAQTPGGKPGAAVTVEYHLEVSKIGPNVASEPIVRDLPPYYLPQAIGQLLPRLVPTREPNTYLFATWVSEAGQVMFRYIDVGREAEVVFAGRRIRAVPVKDHIGLEGTVTTHYISPEGKYLGCVNDDSKITLVATDAETLRRIWPDNNLSRPADVSGGRR